MTWASAEEMKAEAMALMSGCLECAYLSFGTQIQADLNNALADMAQRVNLYWKFAADRKCETDANLAYVMEKFLTGVAGLLKMFVHIKTGKMREAWNYLIDAQHDLVLGLRYHDNDEMTELAGRLAEVERNFFPPQVFTSSGMTFKRATCSICGEDYGTCGHIGGRLYLGAVCGKVVEDFEADHLAIVDYPKDKGCRVYAYHNGARWIDKLTGLPVDEKDTPSDQVKSGDIADDDGIMKVKVIVLRARTGGVIERLERVQRPPT